MRLIVVAVGRLKDGPERTLCARYAERAAAIGPRLGLSGPDIVELTESRARDARARQEDEAARILEKLGETPFCALDERGGSSDSAGFARMVASRRDSGARALGFALGGPDGLDAAVRARAATTLCFGAMTLPHQLARIVLLEQLYRAMTLLADHPYHRA